MKAKITYKGKEAEIEITPELEKLLEINNEKWEPLLNEECYYINYRGSIDILSWAHSSWHNQCYEFGNIYRTEEEAGFELEKRKLLIEMQRFTDEYKVDWTNERNKYYIYYNHDAGRLSIDNNISNQAVNTIYFINNVIAEKAIEKFGDRIKKYLL